MGDNETFKTTPMERDLIEINGLLKGLEDDCSKLREGINRALEIDRYEESSLIVMIAAGAQIPIIEKRYAKLRKLIYDTFRWIEYTEKYILPFQKQ